MDPMEMEAMLEEETPNKKTPRTHKQRAKGPCKSKPIRTAFGCVLIGFVALMAAVVIFNVLYDGKKSLTPTEKRNDIQENMVNITFTMDYNLHDNNQPSIVKNLDVISDELTNKLNGKSIRVINGLLGNEDDSTRTNCEDPLTGNILQLNIVPSYAVQCTSQEDIQCKNRLMKQLRTIFRRLQVFPLTIQLNEDSPIEVNAKLCQIETIDNMREETIPQALTPQRPRKRRTTTTTARAIPVPAPVEVPVETPVDAPAWVAAPQRIRHYPTFNNDPYVTSRKSQCTLCLNKIGLVQMDGDHGSDIQDDIRTYVSSGQYRRAFILTVFEDSTHKLHIQLDCAGNLGEQLSDSPCSNSLSAHVWIDFNDNGIDDGESRLLHRSWSTDGIPTGSYELDVYIPGVDDMNTRSGQHTMKITLAPSHEYQSECGTVDYKEQKDYAVNIIRKARHIAAPVTIPYVVRNPLCSVDFGKLILVLMAGEKGTEIRDDLLRSSLTNYHRNEHHLAVTLYEHTIYLLRVQLDCSSQLRTELTETGCNLAQDVNVFLDLNDDGRYDSSEIGAPHLWPITSYLPDGIYDLQIHIPYLDERFVTSRQHRMRIVVTPSDHYRRICGNTDYVEERNYYVNIVSRTAYIPSNNFEATYVAYDNITCTPQVGKIILVVMGGEYRTQIRDDPSTNALLGTSDEHQQHLSIMLREGTTYLLRLQFECTGHQDRSSPQHNCNLPHEVSAWIDLNDDGQYQESESATPFRWPLTSYLPQGVYDLQLVVPIIDGRRIKSGPHKMKLVVTLNEQYRRKCNMPDYQEIRYYTVTIVSHTLESANVAELGGAYLKLSDRVCTQSHGRIVLVIMAGEDGTQIRDDTFNNTIISDYQNRHHMSVTLFENTNYRIRIQLDCELISSRGPLRSDCNLAQDVNVLIDQNNDHVFSETETVTPNRWPLRSSIPLGLYDYEIRTPPSMNAYRRENDLYRVRIVVKPSDEYVTKCGHTSYAEVREYSFKVIPRPNQEHRIRTVYEE